MDSRLRGDRHRPSACRTLFTPDTMFASFSFAAQRAVCERPQSEGVLMAA